LFFSIILKKDQTLTPIQIEMILNFFFDACTLLRIFLEQKKINHNLRNKKVIKKQKYKS